MLGFVFVLVDKLTKKIENYWNVACIIMILLAILYNDNQFFKITGLVIVGFSLIMGIYDLGKEIYEKIYYKNQAPKGKPKK